MTEARRILVVDDEALARRRVARMVREFDPGFVIEEAESGVRAVELIAAFRPEVVFLDVEMPGLNGFEVLRQCETRPFHVIFQTAYDHFAVRAFEEQACDYLLKPFTSERLHAALSRALQQATDEQRLRALEAQLRATAANGQGYLQRLAVKQGTRLRVVQAQEIACFISRDHCTCVYFEHAGRTHEAISDLSLARLLERLDPRQFHQLHRNSIVRAAAVAALARTPQGEFTLELSNGMRLPVSRSHQRAAKALVRSRSPE